MGRRHHGDGFAGDVDAQFGTARQDVGEVLVQELGGLVRDVQVHTIEAVSFHFGVDGTCHHVSRRQFGARVVVGHEPPPTVGGRQLELPAFTTHRFADQKALGVRVVQTRRVELDELQIGDPAARSPGGGNAIAGGGVRVAGVEIHLARATGGQHGVAGGEGDDAVMCLIQCVSAQTSPGTGKIGVFVAQDQVHQGVVFQHADG